MTTAARGVAARGVDTPGRAQVPARRLRSDRWWLPPAATAAGLLAFVVYGGVRAFQQQYFFADERYLTPFYSPCVSLGCASEPGAAHFGMFLPDHPLIPYAALSLPFLLGFRLTCYYYRKAYYRSIWIAPAACAVPEPHATYTGETRFPLILQNAHRYFFYVALLVSLVNTYDAIVAFRHPTDGFVVGVGNLVLLVNVALLWLYTVSCHSCRHVMGGRLTHFSKHPVRYWLWTRISALNTRHMLFAWVTLGTLVLTDLYVMLVARGTITDLRLIG
ncbi:hypothetical protein LEP48_03005 [Isoptericola sp. NEAU-Y5]|uniref:Succinate dehydrogenase membrane anchor subunit n=1 Tax=Isoptericola luteus TaxID=2879484 RepID=A0ABS7ZB93_9MICO|nr:hypothetical protein [Isoptericola sp. NEAU-Y5]MCA5892319.1 hypothetical protein [Isoptericola sp. NEAU-Y5]